MIRRVTRTVALLAFQQDIGLSQDQIAALRSRQPVAKTLPSRTPAEVFLFGAVYIHAAPESYRRFAIDFEHPEGQIVGKLAKAVGNPPQLSDLKGISFERDEIAALKNCKPSDCLIQMPASGFRAGGSNGSQGIDCWQGRRGPVSFQSTKRTHDH